MSGAIARPSSPARESRSAPVIGRAGIAVHEHDRLRAVLRPRRQHRGPDAANGDLNGRNAHPSIIVVDLGRAASTDVLSGTMRAPGQALSPDVLGDQGADLAQQRSPVASATRQQAGRRDRQPRRR